MQYQTVNEPQLPTRFPFRGTGRLSGFILAATMLCVFSGCVFRRMTVRSDPPGALVLVDGKEIGYTPVSVDFTYYGTRRIELIKPGYETLNTLQSVPAPWYQIPPIDFVSDNLTPFKITNRHEFAYALHPLKAEPSNQLLDRANSLRSDAQMGR